VARAGAAPGDHREGVPLGVRRRAGSGVGAVLEITAEGEAGRPGRTKVRRPAIGSSVSWLVVNGGGGVVRESVTAGRFT